MAKPQIAFRSPDSVPYCLQHLPLFISELHVLTISYYPTTCCLLPTNFLVPTRCQSSPTLLPLFMSFVFPLSACPVLPPYNTKNNNARQRNSPGPPLSCMYRVITRSPYVEFVGSTLRIIFNVLYVPVNLHSRHHHLEPVSKLWSSLFHPCPAQPWPRSTMMRRIVCAASFSLSAKSRQPPISRGADSI